jgi:hypothetical protein
MKNCALTFYIRGNIRISTIAKDFDARFVEDIKNRVGAKSRYSSELKKIEQKKLETDFDTYDNATTTVLIPLGEPRVGKSLLINSILGGFFVPSRSGTPSTGCPVYLTYGDMPEVTIHHKTGGLETHPVDMDKIFDTTKGLIDLNIVGKKVPLKLEIKLKNSFVQVREISLTFSAKIHGSRCSRNKQ